MADQTENDVDWNAKFLAGHINLADAIFFHLRKSNAPAFLIDSFFDACERYKEGEYSDLAEPFGLVMSKREKNREERNALVSYVKFHVDSFAEQGYSKTDPTLYGDTAFHKAGELLDKKVSWIFDIYYRG
jgi:hypothetical protein